MVLFVRFFVVVFPFEHRGSRAVLNVSFLFYSDFTSYFTDRKECLQR